MSTQSELEDALRSLGWEIDGPKRTPGGWKASIKRGNLSILTTGETPEEVLAALLLDAQQHAKTAPL